MICFFVEPISQDKCWGRTSFGLNGHKTKYRTQLDSHPSFYALENRIHED